MAYERPSEAKAARVAGERATPAQEGSGQSAWRAAMRVTTLAIKTPMVSAAIASQPPRATQSQPPCKRAGGGSPGSVGARGPSADAPVSWLVIARLVQMPIYPLASFYAIWGYGGRDTF